jgi:hypothetical protein
MFAATTIAITTATQRTPSTRRKLWSTMLILIGVPRRGTTVTIVAIGRCPIANPAITVAGKAMDGAA